MSIISSWIIRPTKTNGIVKLFLLHYLTALQRNLALDFLLEMAGFFFLSWFVCKQSLYIGSVALHLWIALPLAPECWDWLALTPLTDDFIFYFHRFSSVPHANLLGSPIRFIFLVPLFLCLSPFAISILKNLSWVPLCSSSWLSVMISALSHRYLMRPHWGLEIGI